MEVRDSCRFLPRPTPASLSTPSTLTSRGNHASEQFDNPHFFVLRNKCRGRHPAHFLLSGETANANDTRHGGNLDLGARGIMYEIRDSQ